METIISLKTALVLGLALAATVSLVSARVSASHAPLAETDQPLVVRVAVFDGEQAGTDNRRDFINNHIFPTVRPMAGYVGTFIGREPGDGQVVSISFWRSADEASAGELAVRRMIEALPPGSAPKPSKVQKFVVFARDVQGEFAGRSR